MRMCPLTRSAEQTAGAKCSESCEWWLEEHEACVERAKAIAELRIADALDKIAEYLKPVEKEFSPGTDRGVVGSEEGDDDAD